MGKEAVGWVSWGVEESRAPALQSHWGWQKSLLQDYPGEGPWKLPLLSVSVWRRSGSWMLKKLRLTWRVLLCVRKLCSLLFVKIIFIPPLRWVCHLWGITGFQVFSALVVYSLSCWCVLGPFPGFQTDFMPSSLGFEWALINFIM